MACVIHQGFYTSISSAYEALMQWIADNDYQISGFCREVYLVTDDEVSDHAQIFTEVQIPVVKQPLEGACSPPVSLRAERPLEPPTARHLSLVPLLIWKQK